MVIKNFRDLTHWTKKHNDPIYDKIMWEIPDPGPRQKMQQQVMRYIYNYLSALFGFIEFHRSHNRDFLKTNEEIYKRCLSLTRQENPSHKFFQDLRNYMIHYKPIPFGSQIAWNIDWDTVKRSFYVSKNELLEWQGWSTDAKSFLLSQQDKIPLFDILTDHFKSFITLQFEMFTLILKTNLFLSSTLKKDLHEIFDQAELIHTTGSLPFNKAFLRYISFFIDKANFSDKHGA